MKKDIYIAINIYNMDIVALKIYNTKSAAIKYISDLCIKNQNIVTSKDKKEIREYLKRDGYYDASLQDQYIVYSTTIKI